MGRRKGGDGERELKDLSAQGWMEGYINEYKQFNNMHVGVSGKMGRRQQCGERMSEKKKEG